MFGMPLMSYAQNVFFDFNTNTNGDNFYVCTGIDHTFGPGEFKTSAKFTQVDGFEKFRSALTDVQNFITNLDEANRGSQPGVRTSLRTSMKQTGVHSLV
jgi:hypothetical protein